VASKLILVSAGHTNVSGQDRGAAGHGFIEGQLAVELRDAVAAEIRAVAPEFSVIEDGVDGKSDPLKKALVLARKADIAVEFHWNAGPATATGIEVLSKPAKKLLAKKLANAISSATGLRLRGEGGWKADNSGQHHRLAFCEAGGLIVEAGFISNRNDVNAYTDNFPAIVQNLAFALTGKVRTSFPVPFAPLAPAPDGAADPAPITLSQSASDLPVSDPASAPSFFTRASDWGVNAKAKWDQMNIDPTVLSGSSRVTTILAKSAGYGLTALGWLKDNPIYLIAGIVLVGLGIWYLNGARNRLAQARTFVSGGSATTVNVTQ
jgi:N-acetylmuramoyl-L-alanine amidase